MVSQEIAFGLCGLTVEQFWKMTPVELTTMAESKAKFRDMGQAFQDTLNGVLCSTIASVFGIKDTKPVDFMITRREVETIIQVEAIDQKFQQWAAMTGGKNVR